MELCTFNLREVDGGGEEVEEVEKGGVGRQSGRGGGGIDVPRDAVHFRGVLRFLFAYFLRPTNNDPGGFLSTPRAARRRLCNSHARISGNHVRGARARAVH